MGWCNIKSSDTRLTQLTFHEICAFQSILCVLHNALLICHFSNEPVAFSMQFIAISLCIFWCLLCLSLYDSPYLVLIYVKHRNEGNQSPSRSWTKRPRKALTLIFPFVSYPVIVLVLVVKHTLTQPVTGTVYMNAYTSRIRMDILTLNYRTLHQPLWYSLHLSLQYIVHIEQNFEWFTSFYHSIRFSEKYLTFLVALRHDF